MKPSKLDMCRTIACSVAICGVLTAPAACRTPTRPDVPLTLSDTARTVDGVPLPAIITNYPGTANHLIQFTLDLTPDGLWAADGWRYPESGSPNFIAEFRDNGSYTFDGTSLVLHSNFTHLDWQARIRGDTLVASVFLSIADRAHTLAFWP